jgi:hypothetical protein
MSTYQGTCGACDPSGCCSSPVLPNYSTQLSTSQTADIRSAAVIYSETVRTIRAGGTPRFASHADYLKYKRAQALASGASRTPCRPPPSDAIRQIEAIGCPTCTSPTGENIDISFYYTAADEGVTPPIPSLLYYWDVTWTPFPGATSYIYTTTYPTAYAFVSTGATSVRLFTDRDNELPEITLTGISSCGFVSITGTAPCFLVGALVTLGDGSTLPIEEIRVGDTVLGAFGEVNTVLALHRPLLGSASMCRINDEHSTTSHHPHISPDRHFYCLHPAVVDSSTYGRKHEVINAEGQKERRMLHGLQPGRVQTLSVGQHLKTVEGERVVSILDEYALPPETQLYNLVVSGSHTYHVDGYAVTGWPREDDFDYESWTPKV